MQRLRRYPPRCEERAVRWQTERRSKIPPNEGPNHRFLSNLRIRLVWKRRARECSSARTGVDTSYPIDHAGRAGEAVRSAITHWPAGTAGGTGARLCLPGVHGSELRQRRGDRSPRRHAARAHGRDQTRPVRPSTKRSTRIATITRVREWFERAQAVGRCSVEMCVHHRHQVSRSR